MLECIGDRLRYRTVRQAVIRQGDDIMEIITLFEILLLLLKLAVAAAGSAAA